MEDLQKPRALSSPGGYKASSFPSTPTHQDMWSPDHRITPQEAWKVQCRHLQTALRCRRLGLNPDCQMTECWSQFNPDSPHVTLHITLPSL